ncbi:hypothetical protein WMY93_022619 [Mugilogobius chulae]|uniref:Uncharacterized protein n=1 Tax=Mugilogobius chulae TaxID=88201 RepID=A0AAW0NC03_9GOBI
MAVKTLGLVLLSLSAVWVHCVSAGGAYCAKTARARAAALGLEYPGVHGAPNLSGPPSHSVHHPQPFQSNPQPPAVNYNTFYNPFLEFPHFQPVGSGSHSLLHSNLLSSISRGEPLNKHQSNFEQVKRVGPLTERQPPSWDGLEQRASESHKTLLPFVYGWPGAAGDASVPNGHGMSGMTAPPLLQTPASGLYYVMYPVRRDQSLVWCSR